MKGHAMNTTPIEKAPGACDTEGFETTTTNSNFHTNERKSKEISILRAQLAVHDHELTAMLCNDFLVHADGKKHYCKDLVALQAFAHRLGVSK